MPARGTYNHPVISLWCTVFDPNPAGELPEP